MIVILLLTAHVAAGVLLILAPAVSDNSGRFRGLRDMSRYFLPFSVGVSLQRNDACIAAMTKLSAELTRLSGLSFKYL